MQECDWLERRETERSKKTFIPACLNRDDAVAVAMMRDLSESGAGFESDLPVSIDDLIDYKWGNEEFRSGRVIWADGSRFGVRNISARNPLDYSGSRYRSVRVPSKGAVRIYCDGSRIEGELVNVSQRGFCVSVPPAIRRGSLATIEVNDHCFEGVTAKWVSKDKAGLTLPAPLSLTKLNAVLQGA